MGLPRGITPSPPLPFCGSAAKGGADMRKPVAAATPAQGQNQQPQIQLREVSISELVAMAINKRRKMLREGKTTRRIPLFLAPHLIAPASGTYETSIGTIRVISTFRPSEGRWVVTVCLPAESGFQVKDHLPRQE